MKLSPVLSALAIFVLLGITGALMYSRLFSREGSNLISQITPERNDTTNGPEPKHPPIENPAPPVPPGFEEESKNVPEFAKSWEDLPPGGQYTETVPMRYEGEDCGIWVQNEDESWVKK